MPLLPTCSNTLSLVVEPSDSKVMDPADTGKVRPRRYAEMELASARPVEESAVFKISKPSYDKIIGPSSGSPCDLLRRNFITGEESSAGILAEK